MADAHLVARGGEVRSDLFVDGVHMLSFVGCAERGQGGHCAMDGGEM